MPAFAHQGQVLALLFTLFVGCSPAYLHARVDVRAEALPLAERSTMLGSKVAPFGLPFFNDDLVPVEPVVWMGICVRICPSMMEFAPGAHTFAIHYPSLCHFTVMMEAGHSYQVVGRNNETTVDGHYYATVLLTDVANAAGNITLELPCTRETPVADRD